MTLSTLWLAPLGVGILGAAVIAMVAARLRREVEELQKSLRPLRLPPKAGESGPRAR